MIIWGWRSYLKTLGMVTFVCSNCHNPAAQRIVERLTKFCLFFIPLFPVGRKYLVTCTYCGISSKIDKAAAENYVAAGHNQPAPGLPPQHPDYAPQNQGPQNYPAQNQAPQNYPVQNQAPQNYPAQAPQNYPPQNYGPQTQPPQTYPQHPGQGPYQGG